MQLTAAAFNENVMIEINIDNTGDNVEDLVIKQLKGDKMFRTICQEQLEHLVQLKQCCFWKCCYF
jgi:hypothetical protein